MLGLNMFALIVFAALNGVAVYISRCMEDNRNQILRLVCAALLVFNAARYALSPLLGRGFRVPVEFSTFSYFVVPLIVLFQVPNEKAAELGCLFRVYGGFLLLRRDDRRRRHPLRKQPAV